MATNDRIKNACELVAVVMAEIQDMQGIDKRPTVVAAKCSALIRQAHALDRLNEVDCNRGLTPGETARQERLEKRVREIATELGLTVKFNSDPRGASVRLLLPYTKRYNTWGGESEGWAVL